MPNIDPALEKLIAVVNQMTDYIADTANLGKTSNKEKKSFHFRLRSTLNELIQLGVGKTHRSEKKEKKQDKKNLPHLKLTMHKFWNIYKEGHETAQNTDAQNHELALADLIMRVLTVMEIPHELITHHAPLHKKIDWTAINQPILKDLDNQLMTLESKEKNFGIKRSL